MDHDQLPIASGPAHPPSPVSLRTDTIGIFLVLTLSGLAQLIGGPPASFAELTGPAVQLMWSASLFGAGLLGLLGSLAPERVRILGMGMEVAARIALGCAAAAYAVALAATDSLVYARPWLAVLTYTGISLMMFVGAVLIVRWLRKQRAAVDIVMTAQALAEDEADQPGGT